VCMYILFKFSSFLYLYIRMTKIDVSVHELYVIRRRSSTRLTVPIYPRAIAVVRNITGMIHLSSGHRITDDTDIPRSPLHS